LGLHVVDQTNIIRFLVRVGTLSKPTSMPQSFIDTLYYKQCSDEIVPDMSTSTTLRNTPLTYKHDPAGSLSITGNQLNRVYVRARGLRKVVLVDLSGTISSEH
jgi:hypothetical protein